MKKKKILGGVLGGIVVLYLLGYAFFHFYANSNGVIFKNQIKKQKVPGPTSRQSVSIAPSSPLSISAMRQKTYPGSKITIEQTLSPGPNYVRYRVFYMSDGLKIYGLLTVPTGTKPASGWPVILFNHGYIPPREYSTDSSYAVMVDPLAEAGYMVFKPDYRGNGESAGTPIQIYVSPDYGTDSMNALSSIRNYKDADPEKIGVFGHSMGGSITLHELIISHVFKAAELMAGVVGDEPKIISWWNERYTNHSIVGNDLDAYNLLVKMIHDNGTPQTNPSYWNSIDPTEYISDITTPVEVQVGTADNEVPPQFSYSLRDKLQQAGKTVVFHEYQGANHNLYPDLARAMQESVLFFSSHLK